MNNDDFFRVIDPEHSRSLAPSNPYRTKAKPKPKQKPEAKLQAKIIKWLRDQGFDPMRTNSGSFVGASGHRVAGLKAGSSDIHFNWYGRFTAIEVKRIGEWATPQQVAYIEQVNRNGGLAFVANTLEDVKARLATELATPLMQLMKRLAEAANVASRK